MTNTDNEAFPCITAAINELKAERKALEEEKRNISTRKLELSKKMERNFLAYKNQIVDLLNEGITPEKICQKFEVCGVLLDLDHIKDYSAEDDLNPDVKFAKTFIFWGVAACVLSVFAILISNFNLAVLVCFLGVSLGSVLVVSY